MKQKIEVTVEFVFETERELTETELHDAACDFCDEWQDENWQLIDGTEITIELITVK